MTDEIKKRAADRSEIAIRQTGAIGYDVVRRDDEFVERYCGPVIDRVIEADRARSEQPQQLTGDGQGGVRPMTADEIAAVQALPDPGVARFAELRPPPEHAGKLLHWVQRAGDDPTVWTWRPDISGWAWINLDGTDGDLADGYSGGDGMTGAQAAYANGYRYLGPAEWVEPAPFVNWRQKGLDAVADRGARIAALDAENIRLRSNVRAGVNPDPGQTWTGHMIWWPDELRVPFFDGEIGKRTVAAWSVKLTPSERLSASWEHLPCITTGATVPRPAGGFPAYALRGGVPR